MNFFLSFKAPWAIESNHNYLLRKQYNYVLFCGINKINIPFVSKQRLTEQYLVTLCIKDSKFHQLKNMPAMLLLPKWLYSSKYCPCSRDFLHHSTPVWFLVCGEMTVFTLFCITLFAK